MMKWRVLTLLCINMYRIPQERYSIFLSVTVKSVKFQRGEQVFEFGLLSWPQYLNNKC